MGRSQNIGLSRDPSGDRLALSSKISRQSSKEQMRSDSRFSNYSGGLPDLETDDSGWIWCDGLSTNAGKCWNVATMLLVIVEELSLHFPDNEEFLFLPVLSPILCSYRCFSKNPSLFSL